MLEYITYEMFGAVGDGKTDDMPAIVKAHDEANRLGLPVKAKEGAVYYISPRDRTATVKTSADWTGAKFIIDDVNCENIDSPIFHVASSLEPLPLEISSLSYGQTHIPNPHGCDLFVMVLNENHMDYIRKGLNQDNGHARTDVFILYADGSLSSSVSFDFDEVTSVSAYPIDKDLLTLTGGEFTTIANQAESKYNYHARGINVTRSNVEVSGFTHLVTGEIDHGAPYSGILVISECANVCVHDCVFTAHYIYWTIGSAGLPVAMGSYDISLGCAASISFARCSQTTDIMDNRYWGLMGSNFCRDLLFEDCVFSRFDAHMGVSNCTLRRCKLGWQCLNAIGNGDFLIEETDAFGRAFVSLRGDYGCTWRGSMTIRNCLWHPQSEHRAVFHATNDGTHDFGYDCYLPEVTIDGLTIAEENPDDRPLCVFNEFIKTDNSLTLGAELPVERKYPLLPPKSVTVRNIHSIRPVALCENPDLMPGTEFIVE